MASSKQLKQKSAQMERRHRRVRSRVNGTTERPRLNVFRSLGNIYAQVIDDSKGHTVAAASSRDKDFAVAKGSGKDAATEVGKIVASRATAAVSSLPQRIILSAAFPPKNALTNRPPCGTLQSNF